MTDSGKPPTKPDRAERLAEALRANLKRRKAAKPKKPPSKGGPDT